MAHGIVVGFGAEAALLKGARFRVAQAGGRPERALALARELAAHGVGALWSFGIAGGLAPDAPPGTLVVADQVIGGDGRVFACDPALTAGVEGARRGIVLSARHVVASPDEKARLYRATGALSVDLESGGVAAAAEELGLPFAVVRAVADPAERALPPAALLGLDERGRVRLGAVLASLCRRPGQLPALIRVAQDTRAGLAALAGAVPAVASMCR